MALTSEKLVGFVTPLSEARSFYQGVRSSLTAHEISSVLLNRRGQDSQRHKSNDELDDLHFGNLDHV